MTTQASARVEAGVLVWSYFYIPTWRTVITTDSHMVKSEGPSLSPTQRQASQGIESCQILLNPLIPGPPWGNLSFLSHHCPGK